jgi:hypothetical protein
VCYHTVLNAHATLLSCMRTFSIIHIYSRTPLIQTVIHLCTHTLVLSHVLTLSSPQSPLQHTLSRSLTLSLALSHPHLFTFFLIHPFLCTCVLVLLFTPSLTRCPSSLFLICPLCPPLSYSFTPFFARAISLFHSFTLLLVCSLLLLSFSCSKQVL